jgi:predicted phosphohydrolase
MASVRDSGADAVLVGGDTATAVDVAERLCELADATGLATYFVLGNHDFYRGSVASVRARASALGRPGVQWLPASGPRELAPGVVLVGHDGWGDARIGNFAGSDVVLTDYLLIEELSRCFRPEAFQGSFGERSALQDALLQLGADAATTLAPHLAAAAAPGRHVIVLTHVPPFREACWHEGRISDDHWLPGFTCGAMGELLAATARGHPDCRFTVLCGHTHGSGAACIAPNLIVHTQGATYGNPRWLRLEVTLDEVRIAG